MDRLLRLGLVVVALAFGAVAPEPAGAQTLKDRHVGAARERATNLPRSEHDQAVVDGWPLYRTERGQAVFNEAMATLRASEGPAPKAAAFRGCADLACKPKLPAFDDAGWLPAGRLWVSPQSYVLIVRSPRAQTMSRRSIMAMRYFVFHEFHNSSRNTDLYDTISSHSGRVFVPLYMGKTMTDARGHAFVVVVQVAPLDVISTHATNLGSAGPGIEVAHNSGDIMEPLQGLAGALVATMAVEAVPRLQVVNHRGSEGLAMLQVYQRRKASGQTSALVLPFVPPTGQQVAAATGRLDALIQRAGATARIPIAARGVVPQRGRPEAEIDLPALAYALVPPHPVPVRAMPRLIEAPRLVERPSGSLQQNTVPTVVRATRPWFRWPAGGG